MGDVRTVSEFAKHTAAATRSKSGIGSWSLLNSTVILSRSGIDLIHRPFPKIALLVLK